MTEFIASLRDASRIADALSNLFYRFPGLKHILTQYIRYGMCALAVMTVASCVASLLREKYLPEQWGVLRTESGDSFLLSHWENILGRARSSDVQIPEPTVARMQAAITRNARGDWRIYPLGGKSPILVNGERVLRPVPLAAGDGITVGDVPSGKAINLFFDPATKEQRQESEKERLAGGLLIRPWVILLWITEFQLLECVQLVIAAGEKLSWMLIPTFLILSILGWAYLAFYRAFDKSGIEIEALALLLTSIGLGVIASSHPEELSKWLISVLLGFLAFLILCLLLRRLDFAQKLRWVAAIGALGLLAVTLAFGDRNWVRIAGFSLQPSELAKLCFIAAGTATLDRLFARRNMVLFVVLAAACVGMLALMSDFGTALVFFVTFLVIAFMRSGDFASLLFTVAGAAIGGFLVLEARPYVAERFSVWRHAWEYPASRGYQQVRTMSAAASGGLFGMGSGEGWLRRIAAADTDLVFGMVCEEMGLIIALCAIAAIVTFALFAVRSAALGRSTFYVIAACAATAAMIMQVILNVCGSVDILPLTGVTFPFLSNGGSSMIASWGLIAFIKAADTREGAGIAVSKR